MPMPERVNDISDIVQVITGCSSTDADRVGARICQTPEAAHLLAIACGTSVVAVGAGGMLTVAGKVATASGGGTMAGVPMWAIGAALAGAGGLGAKRFCAALVDQTGMPVAAAMQAFLAH